MRECIKLESSGIVTSFITLVLYIHARSHTHTHTHTHMCAHTDTHTYRHTLVVVEKVLGFLSKGEFPDSFPNRSLFSTSN